MSEYAFPSSINLDKNLPTICLVIDTSGSMAGPLGEINKSLHALMLAKKRGSINANIVVGTFSDRFNGLYPIEDFLPLTASGQTALFDAIVGTIEFFVSKLDATNKAMSIFITDGLNNQHNHSIDTVRTWVETAENIMGWDILYVGTSQNAYQQSQNLGIKTGKSLSFANTQAGFQHMLDSMTDICSQWSSGNISHNAQFVTDDMMEAQRLLGARV